MSQLMDRAWSYTAPTRSRTLPPRVPAQTDIIQRFLHLCVQFPEFFFAGFRGHPDRLRLKHDRLREWQRDLKLVPALELDFVFHRNMKAEDRSARFEPQQNRSLLGDVARAAGTVDRKRCVLAVANIFYELSQSAQASLGTGAARHSESESPDALSDAFTVHILTRHDNDPAISPEICRWEDAAVPERKDDAVAGIEDGLQVFVTDRLPADRSSNEANSEVSGPADDTGFESF